MTRFLVGLFVLLLAWLPVAEGKIVDVAIGVKATAGGNLWTEPSNTPPNQEIGFTKLRGGAGAGCGPYVEVRFIKYIGIELDLLFEWNRLWEDQTIYHKSGFAVFKSTTKPTTLDLRIPLLVKGVLPLPGIRLGLVIGPEFVIPLKTESPMDVHLGATSFDFKVESKFRTLLTFGLDMVVELPFNLELPIDLRFSYNPSQPSDWADRVELTSSVPGVIDGLTIQYQNSWDIRLLIGLGYGF